MIPEYLIRKRIEAPRPVRQQACDLWLSVYSIMLPGRCVTEAAAHASRIEGLFWALRGLKSGRRSV